MRPLAALTAILACACTTAPPAASPAPAPPPPAEPATPAVARAEPAPVASPAAPPCCKEPAARDQPPEVKLKLGHYGNARRGIGLVFDRTGPTAKVKFDGAPEILKLDRVPGAGGRSDYIRNARHTVLQAWPDGRVVVFIAGADDGIDVRRDGDADPL